MQFLGQLQTQYGSKKSAKFDMNAMMKLVQNNDQAKQAIMNTVNANPQLADLLMRLYVKYHGNGEAASGTQQQNNGANNVQNNNGADASSANGKDGASGKDGKKQKRDVWNVHARGERWGLGDATVGWMKRSDIIGDLYEWF